MCHSMCWAAQMHRSLLCFTGSLFFSHNVQWSKTAGTKVHVLQPAAASKILHWWIFLSKTVSTCCNHLRCQGGCPCAFKRSSSKCSCSSILSQLCDFRSFYHFGLPHWKRMCVRWLRKPSWCAGSDSGWVAAKKADPSMTQKWDSCIFFATCWT